MHINAALLVAAGTAHAYTVTSAELFMRKNVDSIVMPGKYASHLHSFFGSDAVTANTTTSKQLQAGCTTTQNPNDFSSYWVPTLLYVKDKTYTPVPISRFSAYYVDINAAEVPIPQNYKAVAGKAEAKSQADVDPLAGIQWFCEGDAGEKKDAAAFPSKTCSTHLQTLLLFHDCVNPTTLESTYSGTQHWTKTFKPANRCPAGMKRMPRLRFSIRYDLRKTIPGGWNGPAPLILSSGPSYSTHGDFINGWLPEAAQNMLLANSKRDFASVNGPLGLGNGKSSCASPKDAEPSKGTSDYLTSVGMIKRSVTGRFDRRVLRKG